MGIDLPGELADLLNELGYTWPKSDETAMFSLGQQWLDFAATAQQAGDAAREAVAGVPSTNSGSDVEAFLTAWNGDSSAIAAMDSGATGAQLVAAGLFVCAGVVLALKITVIVQLTILAIEIIQAIATAVPTLGASLLEIPVFKKLTDIAINIIVNQAVEAVLG